ncbi:hypothetical protein NKH77_29655 [Streptomyces sp. M19]
MSITEQYVLDLYRAAARGRSASGAGSGDWRTLREFREFRGPTASGPRAA